MEWTAPVLTGRRHFATLTPLPPPVTVQGNAETGRQLYAVCAACHGQAGEGNPQLNSPALEGQNDWYLVHQLDLFRKGLRGGAPQDVYGAQMKPMGATLATEQAIRDVVSYINTFK